MRTTFAMILRESALGSAGRLWDKAMLASSLRHELQSVNPSAARALGEFKCGCMRRARELAPMAFKLCYDRKKNMPLMIAEPNFGVRGVLHIPARSI